MRRWSPRSFQPGQGTILTRTPPQVDCQESNHFNIDESLALSLDVNSASVSEAIIIYIDHKTSRIPSLKSNPNQRATIQQKLLEKVDGTFLWVDLTLPYIHIALTGDVVRRIDEMPSGLLAFNHRIMQDMDKCAGEYWNKCLEIFSIAALAYRPLHIDELQILLPT